MPEWAKVLSGSIALMVGASAPCLILEILQPRQHYGPEIYRSPEQHSAATTDAAKEANPPKETPDQSAVITPSIAAPDHQIESRNQGNRSEEESGESYVVVAGYRLKITDIAVTLFTGLLVLVGYIQAVRLRQTMIATKAAADALPILERAFMFIHLELQRERLSTSSFIIDNITIAFEAENNGKTPAVISEIRFGVFIVNGKGEFPEYPDSFIDSEVVIPSGGGTYPGSLTDRGLIGGPIGRRIAAATPHIIVTPLDAAQSAAVASGTLFVITHCKIKYTDIFTKPHTTAVCRIYDGRQDVFAEHGGKKYNYRD